MVLKLGLVLAHLSSKAAKECKQELTECEGKVFIKEILEEQSHPVIGPSTMNQQQSLKIPK